MVDSSWGMVAGLDHAAQTASAISWSDLPCGQPGRSARSHLRKRFRSARFSQDAGGGLPEDGVADAWVKQVCDCVHPGSSKSASARIHKWAGPEILNNHSPARLRSQGSCNFFPRLSITPSPRRTRHALRVVAAPQEGGRARAQFPLWLARSPFQPCCWRLLAPSTSCRTVRLYSSHTASVINGLNDRRSNGPSPLSWQNSLNTP